MNSILYKIFFILFFFSCTTRNNRVPESDYPGSSWPEDSLQDFVYWTADPDTGRNIVLHPAGEIPADSLNIESMIRYIKQTYPELSPVFTALKSDTLVLQISDSRYLTDQMGSHGAAVYIAELTYNCTEIPGVHFVALQFDAGEHAAPGTFSRADFAGVSDQ